MGTSLNKEVFEWEMPVGLTSEWQEQQIKLNSHRNDKVSKEVHGKLGSGNESEVVVKGKDTEQNSLGILTVFARLSRTIAM